MLPTSTFPSSLPINLNYTLTWKCFAAHTKHSELKETWAIYFKEKYQNLFLSAFSPLLWRMFLSDPMDSLCVPLISPQWEVGKHLTIDLGLQKCYQAHNLLTQLNTAPHSLCVFKTIWYRVLQGALGRLLLALCSRSGPLLVLRGF